MKNKKLIIIAIAIIAILLIGGGILYSKIFTNTEKLVDATTYLSFKNTGMGFENGNTIFSTNVTNISDKKIKLSNLVIQLKDASGNVIRSFDKFDKEIAPNETISITDSYQGPLSNTFAIEYKLKK